MKIFKGTTSIKIPFSENGGSDIVSFSRRFVNEHLTGKQYDYRENRYVVEHRYMMYDSVNREVYMPINFLPDVMGEANRYGLDVEVIDAAPIQSPSLDMNVLDSITPRPHQRKHVDIMKENPGRYGLTSQTGTGKSFTALLLAMELAMPTLIIVKGLTDQWMENLKKFTTVYDDSWLIKEFKSVDRLLECGMKPKVMVASIHTLHAYVTQKNSYADLPLNYHQFLEHYGVGLKVVDEAHLNFAMGTQIDLLSYNIPWNVYMTATFMSNKDSVRKIFQKVFPPRMIIGQEQYNRYVKGVICYYSSGLDPKYVMKQRGYSQVYFEKWLLKRVTYLKRYISVLIHLISTYYLGSRGPNHKCLIWFQTTALIDVVMRYLKDKYPKLKITRYISGDSKRNLEDGVDIILSTHGSAGTGNDIPNLYTAINTISTKSLGGVEQIKGRLRPLKGYNPIYIDICDTGIPAHVRHMNERKYQIDATCTSVEVVNLTQMGITL